MDFRAYQKIWRLAGVDQLHVNGLKSKFSEADESVAASALACMAPFAGTPPSCRSSHWARLRLIRP